jgi:Fe-S-cluster-containing dehydrogenase component
VVVCPSGALGRAGPREPVVLAQEKCVGCQDCTLACPYGVPRMTADRAAVIKCDLCVERLGRGEVPACVEACPTGTLTFRWAREAEEALDAPPAWMAGGAGQG